MTTEQKKSIAMIRKHLKELLQLKAIDKYVYNYLLDYNKLIIMNKNN